MNKINKIAIIVVALIIFLILGVVLLNIRFINQENSFMEEVLKGTGTTINKPPKEYSDEFAAKIIGLLLYPEDIKLISLSNTRSNKPISLLYDFGENGGKLLSLQKNIDLNNSENVSVDIDTLHAIKLRHKIRIGTDLEKWELIKKESNNSQTPFKRTYLFITERGENERIVGLCFFEGVMVELEFQGFVDDDLIKKFETVTWNISSRIDSVHKAYLRSISEGPLFANDPIINRSDLPDVE